MDFMKKLVYVKTSARLTITIDRRQAGVAGVVTLAASTVLPFISSIKESCSGNVNKPSH
ncbi:hypothetical protein M153_10626000893 [Pseudoloma neurophilia]|uniref:Uncharacterized protein n=1 Tax=Pseudoloma neurophilia TaxID=146866 RepID=A0A0R0M0F2_9MICR|nr:hypothetical protein M153_10626000893 [Pseudoloma neurophilia]